LYGQKAQCTVGHKGSASVTNYKIH